MSDLEFDFSDYHRTIIAFHGTSVEAADRLVAGEPFQDSDNEDDWFGKGVYFWEYAPKQAWWWAGKFKRFVNPAVVGAIIRLGNCYDLLDPGNIKNLRAFYDKMVSRLRKRHLDVPTNARHHRNLDCAVFNYLYEEFEAEGKPVDTARAVYVPTKGKKRVWKGSWIYEESHVQICIRNPKNILAVWHVRPDGRYGKTPPTQG